MRRRTESPLVKCHKGHHISFRGRGDYRIPWHTTGRRLHRHHEPLLCEFLQMALHNSGRSPILFLHGSRRKEKQYSPNPGISAISFSLSFSSFRPSFFFRRREGGKEGTTDCTRGYWGVRGRPPTFITLRCHNRGGKAFGPSQDVVRGVVNTVYTPPLLLACHASYDITGYRNCIPNGPHDC
jgi:hypothetical protein